MFPYVVADIGGTNARFAVVVGRDGEQFLFEDVQILKGANYDDFEDAFADYLSNHTDEKIQAACVAIAGPIQGDEVKMTNLPWAFSQSDLAQKYGLKLFTAINDYTALAVATSRLPDSGLASLVTGTRLSNKNKAILGPGTGLGVAGLAFAEDFWLPIPSEGGHVNIAPADAFEAEIIALAIKSQGHVSAEDFVSGPGLVNLYRYIAEVRGETPELALKPSDISDKALSNTDALCRETLGMFCAFLGTVSGNLALTYGAHGGVYVTGGIIPRFVDFVVQSQFSERFRNKGKMSHFLEDIPVDVVIYEQTAFLGAAAWLEQQLKKI